MIFLAQLALRNLFRNFSRTLITSVTVVFGVALPILGWGMVDGLDENVLRASRTTITGEILLRPDAYPTDGIEFPLSKAEVVSPELAAKLDAAGAWTARTVFPARLVKGMEAVRASGNAYDATTDGTVFPRDKWEIEGAWPASGASEVVLGEGLARLIDAKVGDEVIVEARTFPGAMNALTFRVAGVVNTDNAALDGAGFWVENGVGEGLLQLDGRRTHVAVDAHGDPAVAAAAVGGSGWTARTVQEECADLIAANMIRRYALLFLVGIILLIAGVGIANTVIMAAYERVREVGTLMALGMKKGDVAGLFLLEGAGMGLVAGLLGVSIGAAGVLYWQANGIYFGNAVRNAGQVAMGSTLFMQFRWTPILVSWCFGLGIAVVASLWPARYAANLNPADAVKAD
ncbi:MAG: FtsX-like permease family protein [Pseudomonadota bacterium]|nr:FtsX-like permease family protein [Pseudomonadota bacterium]